MNTTLKTIITSAIIFTLLITATGAGAGAAQENQDNNKEKKDKENKEKEAIQARVDEFTAAWNQHDPQRMSAIWAERGDLINPFGRKAEGRDQVRALFADEHTGPMKESRHQMTVDSVRRVGDLALVDLNSTITGIRDRDGREVPPLKLHIFLVMTQQDGQWMILSARPYAFLPPPGAARGQGSPMGQESPRQESPGQESPR